MTKEDTIIAQVEAVGKPRRDGLISWDILMYLTRTARLIIGFNEASGDLIAFPASGAHVQPSDLPHVSFDEAGKAVDLAHARKHKTTTSGVNQQGEWEKRGAVPGFRMQHRGGFFSPQEAKRIKNMRRRP